MEHERIGTILSGITRFSEYEPAAKHSTMRCGGVLEFYAAPGTKDEFCEVVRAFSKSDVRVLPLGAGSNVLFSDGLLRGVFLSSLGLNGVRLDDDTVCADAGARLSTLSRSFAKNGISLFPPLSGIPGTVGGAVRMNAGAFGAEIAEYLIRAEVFDPAHGAIRVLSQKELAFSYRKSLLSSEKLFLLSATFRVEEKPPDEILSEISSCDEQRRALQPSGLPSLGSFYRKCGDHPTARMIDEAGLKGLTVGGASISKKHAGFFQNVGGATAKDFLALSRITENELFARFGIRPEREIEWIE